MDYALRRVLIEDLQTRRWTHVDAERAADIVAAIYQPGAGEWKVWPSGKVVGKDLFRVARWDDSVSVYDSSLEGRARDVASALNRLQGHDPIDPGTH